MSDVFVLGAGVVGMTSAYALARRGHAVTVIDKGKAPAQDGASFGNGAQLSYSYTDALASPSLIRSLPKYLLGCDPAFRLRPPPSPGFWRWASAFLRNATRSKFEGNTIEVLKLALESRRAFADIANRLDFDHRTTGKLVLYSGAQAMRDADGLGRLKNAFGAQVTILSAEQAIEIEPSLAGYRHSFVGALWSPLDEAGDSQRFCQALQPLLQDELGVTFRFGVSIQALCRDGGRLASIRTDREDIACSRAVLALGTSSRRIAATVGIDLPIWPMQGYSVTLPATQRAPIASITDAARKIVFCRIGDKIRIAGMADIGPGEGRFRQRRFDALLGTAKSAFPGAADYGAESLAWTGFRPMTPDSQPIVGPTKVEGLFLNCGHGSLGWTLSMGTAMRLSGMVH